MALTKRKGDDFPLHRKLGYDHAVEMAGIESELRAQGKHGIELYFASVRKYMERHKDDPTFREKQDAARIRGEKWISAPSTPLPEDRLRQALEEIRDGHNNPRRLAGEVLDALPLTNKP